MTAKHRNVPLVCTPITFHKASCNSTPIHAMSLNTLGVHVVCFFVSFFPFLLLLVSFSRHFDPMHHSRYQQDGRQPLRQMG